MFLLGIDISEINIPAQIVMLGAYIVMTTSFWLKKREKILGLQVLGNLLFAIQYVMLGKAGYTGAMMSVVSIVRAYVFARKNGTNLSGDSDNKEAHEVKKMSNSILYAFVVVYLILSIITWDSIVSVCALIATIVYTFGMWADKPQTIRFTSNIASVFWIIYNVSIGGYVGAIAELVLFSSNIVAMIKNKTVTN